MKPMKAPDVLLQSSTPRDGHREEERVEPGVVKALANVTTRSEDNSWLTIRNCSDLGGQRVTLLLSHPAFHHKNVRHSSHELLKQDLQVVRAFGEQERKSPFFD